LRFNIDGTPYYLPKESYVVRFASANYCEMKIMKHPIIQVWILGLNFFENYYTVFDQEELRVGFAPSIHAQPRMKQLLQNGSQ